MEKIFQALAHPIRSQLLDVVKGHPGCEAMELAARFPKVSRIAVRKHIKILEQAGLMIIEPQGRYRLHYFNVMPIQAIYERWTDEYSRFFAPKIHAFKGQLEFQDQEDIDEQQNSA